MGWFMDRLREPSTMAGLSALGVLFGIPGEAISGVGQLIAGGLAVLSVVMKEKPNA